MTMTETDRHPLGSIRVYAGFHGAPPGGEGGPGLPLVSSLRENLIHIGSKVVSAAKVHNLAIRRGTRYIDVNLSEVFRSPKKYRNTEEYRFPYLFMVQTASPSLNIDVHEQFESEVGDHDFAFVGTRVRPFTLGFIQEAGIKDIIVSDCGLQGQLPHAVLIDVAKGSRLNDIDNWRPLLYKTLRDGLPSPSLSEFTIYAHADLTREEEQRIGLNGRRFDPFVDEVPQAAEVLGINRKVYALTRDGREVVTPLNPEDIIASRPVCGMLLLPTLRMLPKTAKHKWPSLWNEQ